MSDATEDILLADEDDGVVLVTLNRPTKRNAVTLSMWGQIGDLFSDLSVRRGVRAVILSGAGGHFCAGADISEFSSVRAGIEMGRRYDAAVQAAALAVRDCARPTIAAVSGYALGGGCGLALACDFRVGDATTRMGIPAARLGIVYSTLECALLHRQVGLANAKRVLYSGRHFDVETCADMRLLDVVAGGSALAGARALAGEFSANAPLSLQGSKLVLEALASGSAEARGAEIAAIMERALDSADYREGARAFLEKRRPDFAGR